MSEDVETAAGAVERLLERREKAVREEIASMIQAFGQTLEAKHSPAARSFGYTLLLVLPQIIRREQA